MTESSRFKQRLQTLIASPSVSCTLADYDMSNMQVITQLASWFEELGFNCEIQQLPDNKANLIAVLGGQCGDGSGGLVLSGHSDTVPFDEKRWQTDPFKIEESSDRFFGLGTCDMKGFFPVILAAVEALQLNSEELKHPLIVLATADEESSMSGARALVKQSVKNTRYAIIGEPTELRPIRMHKGIAMSRINIQGKAGHSSNPALGNNAIEAMHAAIAEMLTFRGKMQQQYQHPGFTVNEPTMNLGCIHGGDNPNRICGHCLLDFDIRPLPGMNLDRLHDDLAESLNPISERLGVQLSLEKLFPGVDAFEQEETSEIVKLAEKLSGNKSESVAFATEAPYLQQLGLQTIVMGPGSIDQAHQPNEFLHFDQINPAIGIIKAAINECCL